MVCLHKCRHETEKHPHLHLTVARCLTESLDANAPEALVSISYSKSTQTGADTPFCITFGSAAATGRIQLAHWGKATMERC